MSRPIQLLLVDADAADARFASDALRSSQIPHELCVARDSQGALGILRGRTGAGDGFHPDLVLLDLGLPPTGGWSVLGELKRDPELRRIPVVALGGSGDEGEVMRAYDLQANCYVCKPRDTKQFASVVRSIERFWLHVVKLPRSE